jgi:hypothetical protein
MKNIFIGGAMRTGTTLLNNILCHIPNSNKQIPECKIMTLILASYENARHKFDEFHSSYFRDEEDFASFYKNQISTVLNNIREIYNCENVILKNPELTIFMPLISKLLGSEVMFFIMIRNPLDTIASMKKIALKAIDKDPEKASNQATIKEYYNSYISYYKSIFNLQNQNKSNFIFIKYEDLCNEPEKIIELLQNNYSLDLSSYNQNKDWDNVDESFDMLKNKKSEMTDFFKTDLYGKPISKSSIGNYKEVLNDDEINYIKNAGGNLMKQFGYAA